MNLLEKISSITLLNNISSVQKLILIVLCSHLDDANSSSISLSNLQKKCSFKSRSHFVKNIKYLIKNGMLEVIYNNFGSESNIYKINLFESKEALGEGGGSALKALGENKNTPKIILQGATCRLFIYNYYINILYYYLYNIIIYNNIYSPNDQNINMFDEFWKVYPVKEAKQKAKQIWKNKKLDAKGEIIVADVINRSKKHQRWIDGFVPNPTTYLNGRRWEDEIKECNNANSKGNTFKSEKPKSASERTWDFFTKQIRNASNEDSSNFETNLPAEVSSFLSN